MQDRLFLGKAYDCYKAYDQIHFAPHHFPNIKLYLPGHEVSILAKKKVLQFAILQSLKYPTTCLDLSRYG